MSAEGHEPADMATGLDTLLLDGALGPVRRLLPAGAALRAVVALTGRPVQVVSRGAGLAVELARIAIGRSDVAPRPHDSRFADPAWSANPLLRALVQTHVAATCAATDLVADAALSHADHERVMVAVDAVADALAPSNSLLNPTALAAARDTRGASLVRGAKRLVDDLSMPPRVPALVEPDAFTAGVDVAATPGAVILRTPVFELIRYLPQTETVREIPLLVVPPMINKFYLADLAPGRSIVEHLVAGGQQVFVLSWRNPDAEHASWGLDTYGQAILDALAACERITRTASTSLMAISSGGILTAMVLTHLAATGAQHRVASTTFAASVLDRSRATELLDPRRARAAVEASARRGYLDGSALAEVLAWLHPRELVWSRWVSSYLRGEPPAASEILFWNADTTRMTAGLHRDLIDIALRNALATPGAVTMLGTPVDLSKIETDAYVIAGIADRLCGWQCCYRTTQLLGGTSRFLLATSGHIASLVTPPGDPGAGFRVAPTTPADPQRWLASATTEQGSWWPDHLAWLDARSGSLVDAPPELGGRGLHAIAPAPGDYVLTR